MKEDGSRKNLAISDQVSCYILPALQMPSHCLLFLRILVVQTRTGEVQRLFKQILKNYLFKCNLFKKDNSFIINDGTNNI
jgi:hypothetical protein